MKAITIHPLWAWAIVHGPKRVENRTWATRHRGRLAIHASAQSTTARESDAVARALLERLGVKDIPADEDLVRGAVIGVVTLVDCWRLDDDRRRLFDEPPLGEDPFAEGPVCWLLADVEPLDEPVPCRGRQQVWEVQIREAASGCTPDGTESRHNRNK
jgi:hypothetical protein